MFLLCIFLVGGGQKLIKFQNLGNSEGSWGWGWGLNPKVYKNFMLQNYPNQRGCMHMARNEGGVIYDLVTQGCLN